MGKNNIETDHKHRFVNPYNFIPLGNECRREPPKINEEDCYTGYFDCSMRLLTPLFIPNTSSSVRLLQRKEWEKGFKDGYKEGWKSYDFFSYDDLSEDQPYVDNPPPPPANPVIPGSEIRGAVRSVFEAAFNGCMSSVDGKRDLSRGRKKSGMVRKEKAYVNKTVESLLKNNGGYQPCSDKFLCSACQIFGMMDKSEKPGTYAYGSKVRFTDAVLNKSVKDSSRLFEEPIVLPELAEPRPSVVEFYTESPYIPGGNLGREKKQGYWTYDYKYKYVRKDIDKYYIKKIALNENQPRIRGRKFYWHSEVSKIKFRKNKVTSMCQRIRPLKPNTELDLKPNFQFRVYFEQLNKKQLEQLKWSFDFGCPECAHKLGRGKPLGFGSVQIIVDKLHIREIDESSGNWNIKTVGERNKLSYEMFFEQSGFTSEKIPKALKIMSNWNKKPTQVNYPMGEDEKDKLTNKKNVNASHQWFKLNKMDNNYKYNFSKLLPDAIDDANEELGTERALYKLILKK